MPQQRINTPQLRDDLKQPRRILGLLKGKIDLQPADAWDFPDDLTDIMENKTEEASSSSTQVTD